MDRLRKASGSALDCQNTSWETRSETRNIDPKLDPAVTERERGKGIYRTVFGQKQKRGIVNRKKEKTSTERKEGEWNESYVSDNKRKSETKKAVKVEKYTHK